MADHPDRYWQAQGRDRTARADLMLMRNHHHRCHPHPHPFEPSWGQPQTGTVLAANE